MILLMNDFVNQGNADPAIVASVILLLYMMKVKPACTRDASGWTTKILIQLII